MKSIGKSIPTLPGQAPVMVLPGAVLFPHALMPLYIFEPRYRAMLTHALQEDRMFCVAKMKPEVEEAVSASDFHRIAGVGLVRACVGHDDGTSHLVLQGLARVDLQKFIQEKPFRIAEIREMAAVPGDQTEVTELCRELREHCAGVQLQNAEIHDQLNSQLSQISDPAVLADLVAHTYLRNPEHQQEVLEEPEIIRRLRAVLRYSREEEEGG